MNLAMPIPYTTALLAKCWKQAETSTRRQIRSHHHDADEEFITNLLRGEFRRTVEAAAVSGEVRTAFLSDLHLAFSHVRQLWNHLSELAQGISATVTWHPRQTESKTGGDFGIVLLRPSLEVEPLLRNALHISEYRRGLLCQAKLRRRTGDGGRLDWGDFTPQQREILKSRMGYLALVLYEYGDPQRTDLRPFTWQLCAGARMAIVRGWLRQGAFPGLVGSERMIEQLGGNMAGIEDNYIIDNIIAPPSREALVVRIWWRKGEEPPSEFLFGHRNQQLAEPLRIRLG